MPIKNGRKFPGLVMANTIEPKEINWLWYPYIPAGSASMIFGPGGTGKSHIAVDVAARVSDGRPLPGQDRALPAQKVLLLSAEDEFDRVLVPRLIKAHANLNNIAFPRTPFTLDRDGLAMLEDYITGFTAGIAFIDPLVAYIGGKVDINKANETREFTGGLHQMAMRTGTPIIVVHHARKGSEGADFERMMGSADFNNAVRSVMFTTQAPNGDRIMKHVKANYSPLGPTMGYKFGDEGFEWTGTYAEDGTKSSKGPNGTLKVGHVSDAIKLKLANGPLRATDMEHWAAVQGYSHRMMVRAKVGVAESYLVSANGKMTWYWKLLENSNETEVPVMGAQWKPENTSQDREIITRTEERVRGNAPKVGAGGPTDDELSTWMKENL